MSASFGVLLSTVEESEGSERSVVSTVRRRPSIRPDHILRALHCANELRTIRTETLSVHVAISCGDLCFGVLGGWENRWECLISGPCLEDLSTCLDDAPSMQVVMTLGCFEILSGSVALPLAAWDAQATAADSAPQDCFVAAQRILHSTGANLRQFLVDDKGCVLIACWGMPSQTYLDNAHRALTAAVEIRSALMELQMKCSFGTTTGDVYCGTVGSVLRMEYAAIGSVVNMSARLMGKAHGGILIDEPTFLRIPPTSQRELKKLEPILVKGRAEPMQVLICYLCSCC